MLHPQASLLLVVRETIKTLGDNIREFKDMKIEGVDEWVVSRVDEIRGLIKVCVKQAKKIEDIREINNLCSGCNIQELDIGDIIEEAVFQMVPKMV